VKLKISYLQGYEELQAKLTRKASGKVNILAFNKIIELQVKLSSWAMLRLFIGDAWLIVCFTGSVSFKSSLGL